MAERDISHSSDENELEYCLRRVVQSGYSIEYTRRSSRQELKHDHVQFGTPTPVRSALRDSVPPSVLTPAGRIGDMPAQSADMLTTRLDFAARERTTDQSAEDTHPQGQTDIDSYLPSRPPHWPPMLRVQYYSGFLFWAEMQTKQLSK